MSRTKSDNKISCGVARSKEDQISVYTDGGYHKAHSLSCWGMVARWRGEIRERRGSEHGDSANVSELLGVIRSLEWLPVLENPLWVFTDSQYVMNSIRGIVYQYYPKRDWKTAQGFPLANYTQLRELESQITRHRKDRELVFKWIKGHAGHEWNERADQLAALAKEDYLQKLVAKP